MKKLIYLFAAMIMVSLFSCKIEKDYFGESNEANTTKFEITNQISSSIKTYVDNDDEGLIEVLMPSTSDLSNLTVRYFTTSSLSYSDTDILSIADFSEDVTFKITAENSKESKNWRIVVTQESAESVVESQISYSNMNIWTRMLDQDGQDIYISKIQAYAYTPGDGTRNVWSTTAEANAYTASGINYFTTQPMPSAMYAEYARMETVESQTAATFANSGVVTGALFTGSFIFNAKWGLPSTSAPRKMLDFGVSFSGKPKQVKISYRYTPGTDMKDGNLNHIYPGDLGVATQDSCEMYFILHNRNESTWKRVGAAWLRDPEAVGSIDDGSFKEVTLDFVYGEPSSTVLAEKPYMNIGGSMGEVTFYSFTTVNNVSTPSDDPVTEVYADDPDNTDVTHITVMLSSSAYGDKFWAATNGSSVEDGELRGSTLDVESIELIY